MTSVQDKDFRFVQDIKDVEDLYIGNPNFNTIGRMCGVEEEAFFVREGSLEQMTNEQNIELFSRIDFPMSVEPNAAQAEHVSAPQTFANLQKILDQMQYQRERIYEITSEMGLTRCAFSTLPHIDSVDAMANILRPSMEDPKRGTRQRLLMHAFGAANKNSTSYPVLNTALHYTTSIRDMDDDLEKGRRAQFLMPFLLLLMENRSPVNRIGNIEGQLSNAFNQSMHARLALGTRGGIDENYFKANTGDELAHLKFQEVMDTDMFSYYSPQLGKEGMEAEFKTLNADKDHLPKFSELAGTPLGFRTQFYMARSQKWKWLKTKNLFDADGNSKELLQERRDFDPGIHQIQTMTLILAAIDNDAEVAAQVDALLATYGLDAAQHDDNGLEILQRSLDSAYFRGNKTKHGTTEYMNIRYGNGNMREFGKSFMRIMDQFYAKVDRENENRTDFFSKLAPMRYIIETGRTDAQVARDLIRNENDNMTYMQEHNPAWFLEPNKCVGMLVDEGVFKPYTSTSIDMSQNKRQHKTVPQSEAIPLNGDEPTSP